MVLLRVWFIIAGWLFLIHTPGLAESYLRGSDRSGVSYFFQSREAAQLKPQVQPALAPHLPVRSAAPLRLQVVPAAMTVPVCTEAGGSLDIDSPQSKAASGELLPGTSLVTQVHSLLEGWEKSSADQNPLARLLTALGFFAPPAPPPGVDASAWLAGRALSEPDFVVPEMWAKVPKYFAEPPGGRHGLASPPKALPLPRYAYQPRLWGRVAPTLKGQAGLSYCFPVARPFTFRDTWGDPRSGGRLHRAVDIFAPEGTELYAITGGVVQSLATSGSGGIMLFLRGQDGRGYGYMHLMAYAPGMVEGKVVRAGELLGYVGHTGTINCADHLHLQVYPDHNLSNECLINSYDFLVQLCRGIGVTDLNQPRLARTLPPVLVVKKNPEIRAKGIKDKWIQSYQRPWSTSFGERSLQLDLKGPPTPPAMGVKNSSPSGKISQSLPGRTPDELPLRVLLSKIKP
jgi:murein DD-endopeptidase MepM/ murein hydrolase activator NlpD